MNTPDSPSLWFPQKSRNYRFVVLFHEVPVESARASHWDLMLESVDTLKTWALDDRPEPGKEIPATRLPDHRKAYLQKEGPLSKDRGIVTRVATGQFQLESASDTQLVVSLFPCQECQTKQAPCLCVETRNSEKTNQTTLATIPLCPPDYRCSISFAKSSWRLAQ